MKNYLISAPEVVELMGVSESMAYRIIKKCNEELAKKGYITSEVKPQRLIYWKEWQ
ncbi:DNA-binding protein [Eubacterium ventriosum]|uniref:DNA-binding protein n=1 Tax=Eubacterium ventriosum TaxID=39496 RepID=A0A413T6N7_9FIRM|nr:DNA-binding protein [Eubacterium ventriosum]